MVVIVVVFVEVVFMVGEGEEKSEMRLEERSNSHSDGGRKRQSTKPMAFPLASKSDKCSNNVKIRIIETKTIIRVDGYYKKARNV